MEPPVLDDRIHARLRLAAMALLAGVDEAEFTYLRDQLGATDGNLGTHLRKLEEAGYVSVKKEFRERMPVTRYRLTGQGRKAFQAYLDDLARVLGVEPEALRGG
jgi:DNA-binding transcriptional ArsR family regulator